MDYLREFAIPFVGLSLEEHQFNFIIDEKFFACYEYSEIKEAKVNLILTLDKRDRMLVLTFDMQGTVEVTCSRCLDPFDFIIKGTEVLYVKFGEEFREEDVDVVVIPENESKFDIAPYIYDYLHLMVPYRVVHPEDENGVSTCDPDVIKRIDNTQEHNDSDPRWDKLKDLNLD